MPLYADITLVVPTPTIISSTNFQIFDERILALYETLVLTGNTFLLNGPVSEES